MEPRVSYGIVSPPYWTEVCIVGGGPSARGFSVTNFPGCTLLGLNDSALAMFALHSLASVALFSIDNNWIRRHRVFISTFPGEKYLALPLETWTDCADIPGVTYLQISHADGLSDHPGVVCAGCNTGYAALNLAYLKGARKIHLWGYDMDPQTNDQYIYWAPLFRNMIPKLKSRGVRVLNHSRESSIDAFPFS